MSFANALTCVAFSPDSQKVACGTARSGVTITHIDSKSKPVETFAIADTPTTVAWSPDGEKIIVASSDNKLRCWNTVSSHAIGLPFQGHQETIIAASFLDTFRAISLSRDGEVFVWDIRSGKIIRRGMVSERGQTIFVAALSVDDTLLVTSDGKEGIAWEIPGCVQITDIPLPNVPLLQAAIIPNRLRQVVLVFGDMSFRIWDTKTGTFIRARFEGLRNAIPLAMTVSPDGELLALEIDGMKDDRPTHFYNRTGKEFARPNIKCIHPFAFSPDGKNFAASRVSSGPKDDTHKLVISSVKEIIGVVLDVPAAATPIDKGKQRMLPQGFFEESPRGSGSAGGHVSGNKKDGAGPSSGEAHQQQVTLEPTGPKRRKLKFWRIRRPEPPRERSNAQETHPNPGPRKWRDSKMGKWIRHPRAHEAGSPEVVEVPQAQGVNRVAVSRPRKDTKKQPNGSSSSVRQREHLHDRNRHHGAGAGHSGGHDTTSLESEIIHTGRPEDTGNVRTNGCWNSFWNWLCFKAF